MVSLRNYLVLSAALDSVIAQRPSDWTSCDYYAATLYGSNDTETEYRLVEHIVALAFAGGSSISNVSRNLTGILNPGIFENSDIDLRPWFDGTRASSNFHNEPVGINWLDGGGLEPLRNFLFGKTPSIEMNSSNQYRLFQQFLTVFSKVFGCSAPKPSPLPKDKPHLGLAYVHKFMELDHAQISYFIHQFTLAAIHYGFSEIDAQTHAAILNSRYNVRCAPAMTLNPALGPQLLSLCQDATCPLHPTPDCNAYLNLTADGTISDGRIDPSLSSTAELTPTRPASEDVSSRQTSNSNASPPTAFSAGAIAGICIGTVALMLAFVTTMIYFFCIKNRKFEQEEKLPIPYIPPATIHQSPFSPLASSDLSFPFAPNRHYLNQGNQGMGLNMIGAGIESTVIQEFCGSPKVPGIAEMESTPVIELAAPTNKIHTPKSFFTSSLHGE